MVGSICAFGWSFIIDCKCDTFFDFYITLLHVGIEDKELWIDRDGNVVAEAPWSKDLSFNSAEEVEKFYDAQAKAEEIAAKYKIEHTKPELRKSVIDDFKETMERVITQKTEKLAKFAKIEKEKQDALDAIDDILAEYNATSEVDGGLNV